MNQTCNHNITTVQDYWDVIGFSAALKKKREIAHTHTDIYTHKIFKG